MATLSSQKGKTTKVEKKNHRLYRLTQRESETARQTDQQTDRENEKEQERERQTESMREHERDRERIKRDGRDNAKLLGIIPEILCRFSIRIERVWVSREVCDRWWILVWDVSTLGHPARGRSMNCSPRCCPASTGCCWPKPDVSSDG